jgi:hypothetical protein
MATEKQSIKKVSKEKLLAGVYEASFTNGKVVSWDFGKLFPGFADLPNDSVVRQTIMYGAKQKLDDSMAGAADIDEAIEELESTIEALNKGKWTMRVPGEGEAAGGLFARAFAKARNITLADAKTKISEVVAKNQAKNPEASEKAIVSAIRTTMLQSDAAFAAAYDALQKERQQKAKTKLKIELE